jgi:hypothetical protein
MPSKNAIMGDDASYGLDIPEYQAENDAAFNEIKKSAQFSRTTEFKALKAKLESRIEYYRRYQPGGQGGDVALRDMNNEERGWRTLASDLLITEFEAVITAYEMAYQTVKDEELRRETTGPKTP